MMAFLIAGAAIALIGFIVGAAVGMGKVKD